MLNIRSPGSTVGQTDLETSLGLIAECINRAHKETHRVIVVLENMVRFIFSSHEISILMEIPLRFAIKAGAGNIIGSDFAQLAGIIKLVDNQSRVGVCLDTCK